MKLKLDADGHAVVDDGRPVYVHDDGREEAFDAVAVTAQLHHEIIGGAFARSYYLQRNVCIPSDMLHSRFGASFRVEGGRVVGYDATGNKLYSRTNAGELADFDEVIAGLIEAHPQSSQLMHDRPRPGVHQTVQ